jgi:hypothetical protein
MIESSVGAWALFGLLVLVASGTGLVLAQSLPLVDRTGVRPAIGLTLAPFLLGLASVISLAAVRGASVSTRYALIVIVLLGMAGLFHAMRARRISVDEAIATGRLGAIEMTLIALLILAGGLLLIGAVTTPLTQNDSLEYFMAARRLFETGDLSAYPPINTAADPAGFYGPWTHPPLYPALIHATLLCDAMVEIPGLMRLIAPWALVASTGLVIALAGSIGLRAGLLAGLLYLSTPLLFLGAESALLDALSASACALMIALIVASDWSKRWASLWCGVVLGVVMWTHSQMVLLAPLVLVAVASMNGLRNPRWLILAGSIAITALPIAIWPYLGNLARTGSLISDNPAVFALPQQDWDGYFRAARDLSTLVSRVQYGIFKGWHSVEAYGVSFWLMLPLWGLGLVRGLAAAFGPFAPRGERNDLVTVAALFFGAYFAGMCLSVAIGIDLMIKTERYLLMVMPAVALLAGIGAARIAGALDRLPFMRWVGSAGIVTLCALLGVQLAAMANYRLEMFALAPNEVFLPLSDKLDRWPPFQAMSLLRTSSSPQARVLTLKPSDMVYARRRMVSFLDPALLPAYEETTAAGFSSRLAALGITHVHIPEYPLPPLYRSPWESLLADCRLTQLVADRKGHQVYRLTSGSSECRCTMEPLRGEAVKWTRTSALSFGGRKRLAAIENDQAIAARLQDAYAELPLLFQRDAITRIRSGTVDLDGVSSGTAACANSRELRLDLELVGNGFVTVYVEFLDGAGGQLGDHSIGGTVIDEGRTRRFSHRLTAPPEAKNARLIVEHRGTTRAAVVGAWLGKIRPAEDRSSTD